jgi:hypothetical protein
MTFEQFKAVNPGLSREDECSWREWFELPIRDDVFHRVFSSKCGAFRDYPAVNAISRLHELGITIPTSVTLDLTTALAIFLSRPNIHYTPTKAKRIERLAALAMELSDLLREEKEEWLIYWGDVAVDDDEPEPQSQIEVSEMISALEILQLSSQERAEWLSSAKGTEIEPGSNRAPRVRYFYWLMLLGFWKFALGRQIATSTSDTSVYGPLVTFIGIMSERGASQEDLSGDAIRAFIRRVEEQGRVALVREYFIR